jgi:hypothetical protein
MSKKGPAWHGRTAPLVVVPEGHEGMRGLAVIFRCINYISNSLGKVKIRTTEGTGQRRCSALITRSPALAIA